MWIIIAVIVVILLAGIIYLATLDGNYQVKRELEIDAPLATVFGAVVDFKSWPEWSPWLMHEPDTHLTYSDDWQTEGGYYTWDGKLVGAGKLTHLEIKPETEIRQRIEFLRPFKASSEVNWAFAAADDKTRVSWEMIGRMPFLFRFMTRKMEPMIGRDYDLGLALLNGYLNADAPHPEITFDGSETLENFSYWSVPFHGNLRQLEAARRNSIERLESAAAGKAGLPLCLYRGLDPMASDYHAEIAIPIADNAPLSNYTRREFNGGRYFKVTLRGDQRFLPLAWYAAFSHCRMHKHDLDKARPALEIYQRDPDKAKHSNQVTTLLYLAVR